jgi:hypothetical protein
MFLQQVTATRIDIKKRRSALENKKLFENV